MILFDLIAFKIENVKSKFCRLKFSKIINWIVYDTHRLHKREN